jgi:hypothetical protein
VRGPMWLPRDVDEIEAAVANGQLEETHTFDGKALPTQSPTRNRDIAVDVCAMTVDGGSLLYGVGEDNQRRLTVRTPFPLAGQRERIDQLIQTSIVEVPVVTIREYALADGAAEGYLVVAVPQSPRAPHQVVVRGENRYYGRGATGNRILDEREVADLYGRRQRWEIDRDAHLNHVVETRPYSPGASDWAWMHAFARPVTFDQGYLRAQLERDQMELRNALVAATNVVDDTVGYEPDLRNIRGWDLDGPYGMVVEVAMHHNASRAIQMRVGHDGETRFFANAGRRHQRTPPQTPIVIFEALIAGNLASYLSASGAFFALAGYVGSVDVGVAVTELAGAVPNHQYQQGHEERGYPADSYRATSRIVAAELVDRPKGVALDLLRRFHDALGGLRYEPRI